MRARDRREADGKEAGTRAPPDGGSAGSGGCGSAGTKRRARSSQQDMRPSIRSSTAPNRPGPERHPDRGGYLIARSVFEPDSTGYPPIREERPGLTAHEVAARHRHTHRTLEGYRVSGAGRPFAGSATGCGIAGRILMPGRRGAGQPRRRRRTGSEPRDARRVGASQGGDASRLRPFRARRLHRALPVCARTRTRAPAGASERAHGCRESRGGTAGRCAVRTLWRRFRKGLDCGAHGVSAERQGRRPPSGPGSHGSRRGWSERRLSGAFMPSRRPPRSRPARAAGRGVAAPGEAGESPGNSVHPALFHSLFPSISPIWEDTARSVLPLACAGRSTSRAGREARPPASGDGSRPAWPLRQDRGRGRRSPAVRFGVRTGRHES